MCIDLGKENEISKKDAYSIPFMTDILEKLGVACYISTIDLNKTHHQVSLTRGVRRSSLSFLHETCSTESSI